MDLDNKTRLYGVFSIIQYLSNNRSPNYMDIANFLYMVLNQACIDNSLNNLLYIDQILKTNPFLYGVIFNKLNLRIISPK